jgi:hypothetical protein
LKIAACFPERGRHPSRGQHRCACRHGLLAKRRRNGCNGALGTEEHRGIAFGSGKDGHGAQNA